MSAQAPADESAPKHALQRTIAPLAVETPVDASAELLVELQDGDTLVGLLTRAGIRRADALDAGALVRDGLAGPAPAGAEVLIALGTDSRERLQRLELRSGLDLKIILARDDAGALRLRREDIRVDSTPLRFSGRAGGSLYWSLRASGVPAEAAAEYMTLLAGRLDLARDLRAGDSFDLVLAHRRASTGETRTGPLLYAAIDRRSGSDVRLVNWTSGGRQGWFDASSGAAQSAAWAWPVQGRMSSAFGTRHHPILRFVRFHRGVDLSAPWGAPIVAASDGRVTGAGWNGGHGRQVRIAHSGGLETSYSHMSEIAAQPGTLVRRGQVIGYVGSTGFSTGPHLHYEVHDQGRPVDPLRNRHSASTALSGADKAAIRARVRQLLSIGTA